MTSQMNSRFGITVALAVAMTAAVAVAGTVWAKGNGQQAVAETTRIDVSAIHATADVASLPVIYVAEPF